MGPGMKQSSVDQGKQREPTNSARPIPTDAPAMTEQIANETTAMAM